MKVVPAYDSPDLLRELSQGSAMAFTKVYNGYSPRIYANILCLVKDPDIAQEFLQDVFMKVWENRAIINQSLSFQSYLFQISKNLVYDYIRRERVKVQVENYIMHVATELHSDLEDGLAYKQSKGILDAAIEKLPPIRKEVYRLCKLEGLSYKQVSERLNISTSTISDHIVKATKVIRAEFIFSESSNALIISLILLGFYN